MTATVLLIAIGAMFLLETAKLYVNDKDISDGAGCLCIAAGLLLGALEIMA